MWVFATESEAQALAVADDEAVAAARDTAEHRTDPGQELGVMKGLDDRGSARNPETGCLSTRVVEARIDGVGVARRVYALTCFIGVLGLVVLAYAPSALTGGVGVLLVRGIAFNVTRVVSVIWVNRRTTSNVRATVHSFLSQAESIGEILGGFALAVLAQGAGISVALITSPA